MSGAANHVEDLFREEEDLRERIKRMSILAEDGSSIDLFDRYITAVIRV